MGKVIGIGGVFFKVRDLDGLRDWYQRVLGLEIEPWGGALLPLGAAAVIHPAAGAVWGPFASDTDYFEPSTKPFMINLMVDDLDSVLARASQAGAEPVWRSDNDPAGRFAHFIDPEGIKVELWQPKPPA